MIFAHSILAGEPIKVFNYRKMRQDFTFIDDIVEGLYVAAISLPLPTLILTRSGRTQPQPQHRTDCSISAIANTELLRFIEVLEQALGRESIKDFQPMQPGDVVATAADTQSLQDWVGFSPSTPIEVGIPHFAKWFRDYYHF